MLSTVMPPTWDPSELGVNGSGWVVRISTRTDEPGVKHSAGDGKQVICTEAAGND